MIEIAKGYDLLAMDLENYIRGYVAKGHCEKISSFSFVPYFFSKEAKELYVSYKGGKLVEKLGSEDGKLKPWFIREAVTSFFENKGYARSEEDFD